MGKTRKAFAAVVAAVAMAVAPGAFAEGQITAINSSNVADFRLYALNFNAFTFEAGRTFGQRDVLKVCEAIDNSKLVMLGLGSAAQCRETGAFLFSTPAIATSLEGLFRRGGILYVEPSSWSVYNSWPAAAREFFRAHGLKIMTGGEYKSPAGPNSEKTIYGRCAKGTLPVDFGAPRDVGRLRAIRYFDGPALEGYETLVADGEGRRLAVGGRIGKGGVVFSLVYSVMRERQSAYWDNAVESLYGAEATRKAAGRTVYLREARAKGLGGLYVREVPAFTRLYSDTPPPEGGKELSHIDMLLARGEKELAQIVFYNCTEMNMLYRLEPRRESGNGGVFTFLDVLPWRNEVGRVQLEIVTPLGPTGTVFVPSGETKTIFLSARTDLPAGKYGWSFELVPVNFEEKPRRISVTAEVLDVALEGKMPDVYLFGPYEHAWSSGCIEAYRRFLAEGYHVNYSMAGGRLWSRILTRDASGRFCVSKNPADYLAGEARLQEMGLDWIYGYGMLEDVKKRCRELGAEFSSSDANLLAAVDEGVGRWVKALKDAGIDFSRTYEPVKDEPNTAALDDFIAMAKILRRHGMKVAVDIATWGTLDDLRRLAPHVDLWQPWECRLTSRPTAAEELAIYRASGKPIRPYLCSVSGNSASYLGYHRFRGIRAFLLGGDGFCTWAANSWRGNDYRARGNEAGRTGSQGQGSWYVHHGDGGPVATVRLEALREGAEDLYWLRRAAREGKASRLRGEASLRAAMDGESPAAVKAWRDSLLREMATR